MIWKSHLKPNALVVDATCGNGHDALFLSKEMTFYEGSTLFLIDCQQKALDETNQRLQKEQPSLILKNIYYICGCHSDLSFLNEHQVDLFVYNLGYLPGSDKLIKTQKQTTLASLQQAMNYLKRGGLITVTAYPGHVEGREELEALLNLIETLDPNLWRCNAFEHLNQPQRPRLLILQKR